MATQIGALRRNAAESPVRPATSDAPGALLLLLRAALVAALVAVIATSGRASGGSRDGVDAAVARTIIERTNAARADAGLPPLSIDPQLTRTAAAYAREMARHGWFDHTARDGAGVEARAEAAGYADWEYLAENLATGAGRPDADAVVARWLESPDHRRNLLAPELRDAGVACYVASSRYWCAQEFGAR